MIVLVNNKETEIAPNTNIGKLATSLQLPIQGVAIAVNNKMISRTEWDNHELSENDNIVIIKAACGG